jgi:hypothetical protein
MFTRGAAERIATATRQVEGSPLGRIPGGRHHKTHAGTPSLYSGPFACVSKDDTTVTVQGYNASEGRYFKNYAILGTSQNEVAEADVSGLTSDAYVYLDITYSSGYSIALASAAALPAQSATHCFVPIAFVKCADSKISSITQIQYGTIHYPGRVF